MLEAFGARGEGLGHLDFGTEPVNTNDAERGANKLHLDSESCGVPWAWPKGVVARFKVLTCSLPINPARSWVAGKRGPGGLARFSPISRDPKLQVHCSPSFPGLRNPRSNYVGFPENVGAKSNPKGEKPGEGF